MHPNEHCNCRYADVGCDRMEQVMDQISGKWKMRILFMVGADRKSTRLNSSHKTESRMPSSA